MGRLKQAIVAVADRLGCFAMGLAAQKYAFPRGFVRVLNYHATPAEWSARFERQLAFYRRHFTPAGPEDIDRIIAGNWSSKKPGLLMTFDDGYRSNYDIAAPLLEVYGFRGCFFVPEAFIADSRSAADAAFSSSGSSEPEPRMTWAECADLEARGHRIGCHTRSHVRLSDELSAEQLVDEIAVAGRDIGDRLGHQIDDFCWVGGEEWSYGAAAYDHIRRAGYQRVFATNLLPLTPGSSPLWIERTNIEADWTMAEVRFYLSGLMDLAYAPKRRRLRRGRELSPISAR
jgi:peptidoglycan/xylan/chitin deacetylase (PgdA/CDA1 family)